MMNNIKRELRERVEKRKHNKGKRKIIWKEGRRFRKKARSRRDLSTNQRESEERRQKTHNPHFPGGETQVTWGKKQQIHGDDWKGF